MNEKDPITSTKGPVTSPVGPVTSETTTPFLVPSEGPPALEAAEAPQVETQAERILAKFGGARRLSEILGSIGRPRHATTIYKWTYPRSRGGCDGRIPGHVWPDIQLAARTEGILLTQEDFDPRPHTLSAAELRKRDRG